MSSMKWAITVRTKDGRDLTDEIAKNEATDGGTPDRPVQELHDLTPDQAKVCLGQIIDQGHEWGSHDVTPLHDLVSAGVESELPFSFTTPDHWTVKAEVTVDPQIAAGDMIAEFQQSDALAEEMSTTIVHRDPIRVVTSDILQLTYGTLQTDHGKPVASFVDGTWRLAIPWEGGNTGPFSDIVIFTATDGDMEAAMDPAYDQTIIRLES